MTEVGELLVAGSANVDYLTRVPHIPAPGETVLGPEYSLAAGGKGANQAVAAGRAGGRVRFLGALGNDAAAGLLRASLRESGVGDATVTVPGPTGAAFISVSQAGENAITVASGANRLLAPAHLGSLLDRAAWLLLVLEIPLATVLDYAVRARAAGVRVLLNASPAPEQPLPAELMTCLDLLVVNQGELDALVGERGDLQAQLSTARALGPQRVIVTLGGRGSLALSPDGLTEVPAYPVTVLDTTGAGDTYLGVLAAALGQNLPLERAMRRASVAAALACTRAGAQPAMPWAAEIDAALASY